MKTAKIFYSWQSDHPSSSNRGFIQDVLERVAKELRSDDSVVVEPVIDRDTEGVPGSPDIAKTIFLKIDEAAVFVCDVSIIQQDVKRPSPNPNVLIELGYALKSLGWEKVLIVLNEAYGIVENLPFDLRQHRTITYKLSPESTPEEKTDNKNTLQSKLEKAVRTVLSSVEISAPEETSLNDRCIELINNKDKQGWIAVIEETTESIPDSLVEWKSRWEEKVYSELYAKPQKQDALQAAFTEATDLCLPGLIPIFYAVEKGNIDFWGYTCNFMRRLARLEEKIPGDLKPINQVGYSLLSLAGAVGMAIAVKRLHLEIIKQWAILKLGIYSNISNKEYSWIEVDHLNWPYAPSFGRTGKAFDFLVKYFDAKREFLEFFKDSTQLNRCLLTGNFILSLLEFSNYIREEKNREDLLKNKSFMHIDFDISPAWGTMDRHDFTDQTERLFNDLDQILDFCGLKDKYISLYLELFWPLWKIWKRRCLESLGDYGRLVHKRDTLILPGEPM